MFTNIKFQTRIFISFLLLIIAVVVIFSLYFKMYLFKIVESGINENIIQISNKISQQIDEYIKGVSQDSIKMISDKNLVMTLKQINNKNGKIKSSEILAYDRILSDVVFNATNLSFSPLNLYIYNRDLSYRFTYGTASGNSSLKSILNEESYKKNLSEKKFITFTNYNNGNVESFSIVREISDVWDKIHGYIEIQQGYPTLDRICNIGDSGYITIIDKNRNVIFPVQNINKSDMDLYLSIGKTLKYGTFKDSDQNYCSYYQSDYLGWTIYTKYYRGSRLLPLFAMQNATIVIVLVIVTFSLLFLFLISKSLVVPIRRLRNSIINVNPDNMSMNIHEKFYNNELNLLNDGFQEVLDKLKESMDKEIKANKAEMVARFSALQAQISPHFIHNTLYLISISAQENKTDTVVEMCKQLSNMLRYIVSSPFSRVTIEEEILHTNNYLALLKRKYEDFLYYNIELQDAVKEIAVPRLTIQPFVENSIQHGLKDIDPPWYISISCKIENGIWSIEIRDNGSGFNEETINKIRDQLKSGTDIPFGTAKAKEEMGMCHIGIVNTVMRIKMMYGEKILFNILNNKDGGASIQINGTLESDN